MLVLSSKELDTIVVEHIHRIEFIILGISRHRVKVGIKAPKDYGITRGKFQSEDNSVVVEDKEEED